MSLGKKYSDLESEWPVIVGTGGFTTHQYRDAAWRQRTPAPVISLPFFALLTLSKTFDLTETVFLFGKWG